MGCMGDMHRPFILDQFDLEEMCHSDAEGCVLMHVEGAHCKHYLVAR